MAHPVPLSAPPSGPVRFLMPRDTLRLEAEPLVRMQHARGREATHAFIARARKELCLRLDRIAGHYRAGDFPALTVEALAIRDLAPGIGLADLGHAAAQSIACTESGDPVALAATVARVLRLGDSALLLIANLRAPG